MIVCSCNVLSDHDVRAAVHADDEVRRTAAQVYDCLGCSAECGRCARTIRRIISDALGPCARACPVDCHHRKTSVEPAVTAPHAHIAA
jgi:bacterioferritin-associated ferredoxin